MNQQMQAMNESIDASINGKIKQTMNEALNASNEWMQAMNESMDASNEWINTCKNKLKIFFYFWFFTQYKMSPKNAGIEALREKMYADINKYDLIHDTINRDLMLDIIDKMIDICNLYFKNRCPQSDKSRAIFENNVLCFRIMNNPIDKEPSTRDTVLSLLSAVWAFIHHLHESPEKVFNDSVFMNTLGLSAIFKFKNKTVKKRDEWIYKCLNIHDGQPFTAKHYFFNDGSLTAKIDEFLNLNVDDLDQLMKQ